MSATDLVATAKDPEFFSRVSMIMFKVGQAVATEAPTEPNHAERLNYAMMVLRGGDVPMVVAQHVISSNPTIAAAIEAEPELLGKNVPDGDIEFALASIWTARAL